LIHASNDNHTDSEPLWLLLLWSDERGAAVRRKNLTHSERVLKRKSLEALIPTSDQTETNPELVG